ncbi:MFS transporter [Candidatus Saccharibacteria bacterium]|nr:MFS transporter [Candidatus Saccharibacteria bacterium]
MQNFYKVLLNTLVANVTSSFLWFALTFWIYLETKNVMATAIVGGAYMFMVALCSLVFGLIVDRNKKKRVMVLSSTITLVAYVLAGIGFLLQPTENIATISHWAFWMFALLILAGGVVENMRNIALSTTVTLLAPKESRDKANGMVGTVQGVAFMVTSVFSGLSIGLLGMGWTLVIAIVLTTIALLHLLVTVQIPEAEIVHDSEIDNKRIDIRGSLATVRQVPGLLALMLFSTFNNLIGGVFMALMDPYGLTIFSVEWWGTVLGITSTGFVVGGLLVAKKGLGKNPLRTMLLLMVAMSVLGMLFTIREWWWLYVVGIFLYMCLIPAVEASEQTILQRVVPLKRQGRVFGLAQALESCASPISAFLIGPLAQYWLIPYMQSGTGRMRWSWLLGTGQARGIAFVVVLASLLMLALVLLAFRTKAYRQLGDHYQKA